MGLLMALPSRLGHLLLVSSQTQPSQTSIHPRHTGGDVRVAHSSVLEWGTGGIERVQTSYTGAVEGTYSSLPFGDGYLATGEDSDAYHFAGQDQDSSASDHAQYREYSNMSGRWLSPDPYMGSYDLTNPQTMNRYAYVLANPLMLVDPSGLDCIEYESTWSVTAGGGSPSTGTDTYWVCTFNDGGGGGSSSGGAPSGGGSGGGGGGMGNAPNKGPSTPSFWSCTFNGKVGLKATETALDAFGAIPGLGNAGTALQFGAGVASATLAATTGDSGSAIAGYSGVGLIVANHEVGSYVSLAVKGTEVLPVIGNVISGLSAVNDVLGSGGVVSTISGCMGGRHW